MNELPAELPAAGVVRVVGPEDVGAGFVVSAGGLIVTCAHVLAGAVPGTVVSVEPHGERRPLAATVALSRDPPDVAILRLTAPVPPQAAVLPLGRSPATPKAGLRTFGYPQVRPEAGLPGELAVLGVTSDAGYDQLALRSEEATLGFSGAPIWDPELGAVVGMVKSIARADPGQRLGTAAIGVPAEVIRDFCPELRLPAGCPYRGLEPFTEEHAGYYYGRENATSQLLAGLAARDFVTVVAVSGGGKSSLLRAGLAKGLGDRPAAGLAQRVRCYQRVGSRPYAELLHSLALNGMPLPRELAAAPPPEIAAAVLGAVPPGGLIIVADQFERLYTDCADAERKRFVELLLHLATDAVKVVIGLRADFYHLALADLGERLAAGQVALAPMSDQDLGQAIAAPAAKLLRSFQPGLAQRIAADVHGRPGDLPLLQFALTLLWERDAQDGVLTEPTYRGLGVELPDGTHLPGAQGALILRAEQLWQDLSPADRPRLQRILLGLIAAQPAGTGAGLAGSPRDLSRPALLAQWDDDDQRLIQQLVDARLLTADRAAIGGGQATVEVSHEALLRAWPRLRRWLEERGKFVQWRAQDLAPNLERWLNSRKAPSAKGNPEFLLPRSLLDLAVRWLDRYPDELAGPPAAYIRASRRRRTLRRGLAGGFAAVLVSASLVSAGIFFALRQDAVQQQDIADSRLLIDESQSQADSDPAISKLLSVAAWRIQPFSDAWNAMLAAAANPEIGAITIARGAGASSEAFSPDGKTLVIGGNDGTVQVWDVATEQQAGRTLTIPDNGLPDSVALGPDGEILASSEGAGNTVQVWDVATGQQDGRTISVPAGETPSSTLSPDGTTLATISRDGTVQVWDVATGQQAGRPFTFPDGGPGSVALGPGGRTLATISGDGTVQVWDVATGHQADGVAAPLAEVAPSLVALSPDGKTVATGSDDGKVRLFDLATGEQIGNSFTAPGGGAVISLALGPGGKTLASASSDAGTAQVWDVATGRQTGSFTVPGGAVDSLALGPGGKTLALGSTDNGMALVRDVATGRQVGRSFTAPSGGAAGPLALDPNGTTLATGGSHGTVQVRDVATGRQTGSFTVPGGAVGSLALSPGGTTLATVGRDRGTVRVWDAATGQQTRSFTVSGYGAASSLAFSPDGTTLAAASGDGTARVWDLATGQQAGSIPFFPEDAGGITPNSVALSPGGTTLATASGESVQLWDVATGHQIGSLTVPYYGADSLEFSPDGKTLSTGSDGGTVQVWDVAYLTDPVSDLCALGGRSLTRAEWALYAPGLAYRNICP